MGYRNAKDLVKYSSDQHHGSKLKKRILRAEAAKQRVINFCLLIKNNYEVQININVLLSCSKVIKKSKACSSQTSLYLLFID